MSPKSPTRAVQAGLAAKVSWKLSAPQRPGVVAIQVFLEWHVRSWVQKLHFQVPGTAAAAKRRNMRRRIPPGTFGSRLLRPFAVAPHLERLEPGSAYSGPWCAIGPRTRSPIRVVVDGWMRRGSHPPDRRPRGIRNRAECAGKRRATCRRTPDDSRRRAAGWNRDHAGFMSRWTEARNGPGCTPVVQCRRRQDHGPRRQQTAEECRSARRACRIPPGG